MYLYRTWRTNGLRVHLCKTNQWRPKKPSHNFRSLDSAPGWRASAARWSLPWPSSPPASPQTCPPSSSPTASSEASVSVRPATRWGRWISRHCHYCPLLIGEPHPPIITIYVYWTNLHLSHMCVCVYTAHCTLYTAQFYTILLTRFKTRYVYLDKYVTNIVDILNESILRWDQQLLII